MRHTNIWDQIAIVFFLILGFIGAVPVVLLGFLGRLICYIGVAFAFLYMFFIFLPFLILYKFDKFKENPKGFIKEKIKIVVIGALETVLP